MPGPDSGRSPHPGLNLELDLNLDPGPRRIASGRVASGRADTGHAGGAGSSGWCGKVLTARQSRFVELYLKLGNAREAAQLAGYTPTSARSQAYKLLRLPLVAAAIEAAQAGVRARREVTVERIVAELAKLAFADPRDLFTPDGRLKPIHELDEANAASIAAMEVLVLAGSRAGGSRAGGSRAAGSRASSSRASSSRTAGTRPGARGKGGAGATAEAMTTDAMTAGETNDAAGGPASEVADDAATETPVLELRKIKRWDKTKALELLGRYLGLFKDRVELGVGSDLAHAIEAARKRVRDEQMTNGRSGDSARPGDEARVIEGEVIASSARGDRRAEGRQED